MKETEIICELQKRYFNFFITVLGRYKLLIKWIFHSLMYSTSVFLRLFVIKWVFKKDVDASRTEPRDLTVVHCICHTLHTGAVLEGRGGLKAQMAPA